MRTPPRAWRWGVAAVIVVGLVLALRPQSNPAHRPRQAAAGASVPGQLVIETTSESRFALEPDQYDAYVWSVRALAGDTMEDRVDEDVLIRMGRRICFHLTKDAIRSTRDYVREYRSQRRELGFPVFNDLLVQGAAIAETAPATFCPEHVGAVSADEAARIVGLDPPGEG